MSTHRASCGFIGRTQKTAKAECGKTVKTDAIAINVDCDCADCRAAIDEQWRAADWMTRYAEAQGIPVKSPSNANLATTRAVRYQSVYFDQLLVEALERRHGEVA